MATSTIDQRLEYIECHDKIKELWNRYLGEEKNDNHKLFKFWVEVRCVLDEWSKRQPKENRSVVQKLYNKYLKKSSKFLELTNLCKLTIKLAISESKKTDFISSASLAPLKKELDIYLYLIVRSFIFENIEVGQFSLISSPFFFTSFFRREHRAECSSEKQVFEEEDFQQVFRLFQRTPLAHTRKQLYKV